MLFVLVNASCKIPPHYLSSRYSVNYLSLTSLFVPYRLSYKLIVHVHPRFAYVQFVPYLFCL